jgi:hypothetical protein
MFAAARRSSHRADHFSGALPFSATFNAFKADVTTSTTPRSVSALKKLSLPRTKTQRMRESGQVSSVRVFLLLLFLTLELLCDAAELVYEP